MRVLVATIQLPNPEIMISTIEKVLKAFENACPPLEDYSDRVDKGKVGTDKKITSYRNSLKT